jgi:methionyl-tRNA formyltransferase
MKSVFIGSVKFSEKALKKLINLEVKIEGVITKSESSFNSDFVDLSNIASKNNIPFLYTKDINSSNVCDWIIEKEPDIIFCFGWSQLLKKEVLKIPSNGVIGYHPAKIPENKGRHPLIWAVVLGLEETASTFFIMDEGADTGDIISQKYFKIKNEDYAVNIYNKMIQTALEQLDELIPKITSKNIKRVPQRIKKGNSWRKRGKEDGKIDFRMSSENIYNLVRALSKPYVGAHVANNDNDIKIWKTDPAKYEVKNIEPGKVLELDGRKIKVKTGNSAIWLLEHEFDKLPQVNSYL